MLTNTVVWPGYELELDAPGEWVTFDRPELDPTWRVVDANGHGHFYEDGYPTLEWMGLPCTMGHDEDCDVEGYYACRLCRVKVEPGTRMPEPAYVAGSPTYYLTAQGPSGQTVRYVFGKDQMVALQAAVALAVQDTLAECAVEVAHRA